MQPHGRSIPLSLPRRFLIDLLHFARQVPSVPVERSINVQGLREVRQCLAARPSWTAIFTKAFALLAARLPQLRRAYLPYPRPHLYEHPHSVASVTIERPHQDETAVFFAALRSPERQSLRALDAHLRRYKEAPVESIGQFRRALLVSRLPRPLRRLLWTIDLQCSGRKRAARLGTFSIDAHSALGAETLHPLSPLTTTLTYGVIQDDGSVMLRLVYDHRVMDGATVARALAALEHILHHDILAELRRLATASAPARSADDEHGRQLLAG